MSLAGTLDKDWIDQNSSYLRNRLGTLPLFEPTAVFYDDLARLGEPDARASVAGGPLRKLFCHVALPDVPVTFAPLLKNAGEFTFSQHPDVPTIITPLGIRIAEKYRNISNPQARGMAFGTILAHEIAHYCLMTRQIRRDTADNERLTDLGLMVLGFGKLWFNGRNLVIEEREEQVGYLKPVDMTYAYMEYARQNGIPGDVLRTSLSPEARQVFAFWLGMVSADIQNCQRQEALDNAEEVRQALAAQQASLEKNVQKVAGDMKSVGISLAAAAEDQEIINRTHLFWEISKDDHRAMAAFVAARASGAHDTDSAGITRSLLALGEEVHRLAVGLKPSAAVPPDPALLRQALAGHQKTLTALAGRVAALQQQAAAAETAHRRCFGQIDALQKDVQAARALIGDCHRALEKVRSFHSFLSGNPAAWQPYAGSHDLRDTLSRLTGPGAEAYCRVLTEREVQEVSSLLSLPRHLYADRLGTFPPLTEIAGRVLSERDHAARTLRALEELLSSQARVTSGYLEDARRFESQLQDILAAGPGTASEIRNLKLRQDRIYARHDRLSITPEDEAEFAMITKAILSCSPEGEFASCTRRLAEIMTLVRHDMERVKGRTEGALILPVGAHREAFERVRGDLRQVSGRVIHWTLVQQPYIDRLDAMDRSVGAMLRRVAGGIQKSVQAFVTGKKT